MTGRTPGSLNKRTREVFAMAQDRWPDWHPVIGMCALAQDLKAAADIVVVKAKRAKAVGMGGINGLTVSHSENVLPRVVRRGERPDLLAGYKCRVIEELRAPEKPDWRPGGGQMVTPLLHRAHALQDGIEQGADRLVPLVSGFEQVTNTQRARLEPAGCNVFQHRRAGTPILKQMQAVLIDGLGRRFLWGHLLRCGWHRHDDPRETRRDHDPHPLNSPVEAV